MVSSSSHKHISSVYIFVELAYIVYNTLESILIHQVFLEIVIVVVWCKCATYDMHRFIDKSSISEYATPKGTGIAECVLKCSTVQA